MTPEALAAMFVLAVLTAWVCSAAVLGAVLRRNERRIAEHQRGRR